MNSPTPTQPCVQRHSRSPFELGLGWLVDFKKPHFNGRKALLEEKQHGHRYNLVKLDIDGNKPAHDSYIFTTRQQVYRHGFVRVLVTIGQGQYRAGIGQGAARQTR